MKGKQKCNGCIGMEKIIIDCILYAGGNNKLDLVCLLANGARMILMNGLANQQMAKAVE